MRRAVRRHPALAAIAATVALTVGLTGCHATEDSGTPPSIQASVGEAATNVNVVSPILVQATSGTLGSVRLTNDETGKEVKGTQEGNHWSSTEPLGYDQSYTIKSFATKGDKRFNFQRNFHTVKPDNFTMPWIYPLDGTVAGVAQPVAVKFDEPIGNRQAAQDCIHIKTSPKVDGAFYWMSDTEVRWRGEHFWKPGTKINIDVKCYGHDLGDSLYGQKDLHSAYTIGDRVEGFADDNTHQLTIKKNGQVIKTIPISMGSDAHPTPNGIYYIGDKHESMIMDSSTFGVPTNSPEGYKTTVYWATRMSYSGIFIHAAPWSLWAQGSSNTSHGCLNVSPENGEWVYHTMKAGDPVFVKNTKGGTLEGIEGLGDWNIPWSQWKAGNANQNTN